MSFLFRCQECFTPLIISLFYTKKYNNENKLNNIETSKKYIMIKIKCQYCKYTKIKNINDLISIYKTSKIICFKCGKKYKNQSDFYLDNLNQENEKNNNIKIKKIFCKHCKSANNKNHHFNDNKCKYCTSNYDILLFCESCDDFFCINCSNMHFNPLDISLLKNPINDKKNVFKNFIEKNCKIKFENKRNENKQENKKNNGIIFENYNNNKFLEFKNEEKNVKKYILKKTNETFTLLLNKSETNFMITAIPINENTFYAINYSEINFYKIISNKTENVPYINIKFEKEILSTLYFTIEKNKMLIISLNNQLILYKEENNSFIKIYEMISSSSENLKFIKIIQWIENHKNTKYLRGISNGIIYKITISNENIYISELSEKIKDKVNDCIEINNNILVMSCTYLNKIILYYNENNIIKEFYRINLSYKNNLYFLRDNIIIIKGNQNLSIFDCINFTILKNVILNFEIFSIIPMINQVFISISKNYIKIWDYDLNEIDNIDNEMDIYFASISINIKEIYSKNNDTNINNNIIGVGKNGIYKFNLN